MNTPILLDDLIPKIRHLSDLKPVLYEPPENTTTTPAYYMYRDIANCNEHRKIFQRANLRYDITVIPPLIVGREYIKTFGHYHSKPCNGELSYPEIYEVLQGEAYYLLQKCNNSIVEEAILIHAREGEHVIVPPNYGHVTINPSSKTLIMANIVSRSVNSDYESYREKGGACYYVLENEVIPNPSYNPMPELRRERAKKIFSRAIYEEAITNISTFDFLENPKDNIFADELL